MVLVIGTVQVLGYVCQRGDLVNGQNDPVSGLGQGCHVLATKKKR